MIKFSTTNTFIFRAGIANLEIADPTTNPSLCAFPRQIFRPPGQERGRQPTCALRWIALLTFASPKTRNKVKEGVRGPETYFTLFGTGTATTTRQQGLYPSLGLHFICNSGTPILHRSIPILSIVRRSTKLKIHGNSSIARQPVEDQSLLASAIHNQPVCSWSITRTSSSW